MSSKKTSKRSSDECPKPPRCHRCRRAIRVPAGWSNGAATRRHYWRKHPEVMRGHPDA
jgi:hypothetical protein